MFYNRKTRRKWILFTVAGGGLLFCGLMIRGVVDSLIAAQARAPYICIGVYMFFRGLVGVASCDERFFDEYCGKSGDTDEYRENDEDEQ